MIKYCVELQNQFNKSLDENWIQNRKHTDWATAILTEGAEFIESLPWKWWKHVEPDYDNLKLEAVDLLHFIISELLMLMYDADSVSKYIENTISLSHVDYQHMQKYIGEILSLSSLVEDQRKYNEITSGILKARLANALMEVLNSAISIAKFESVEDVFRLYVFKNALNHLRQELGYKKGTYKKLWDGKHEDNYFMMQLAQRTSGPITLEEAINLLREEYYAQTGGK